MRSFLHGCRQQRAKLCFLANGVLADYERANLEKHLGACIHCQDYYRQITEVVGQFAGSEKAYSQIEANEEIVARWERDFVSAVASGHSPLDRRLASLLDWGWDIVWPNRRIWTGFAVVWLAILVINFSTRDLSQSSASNTSRPSRDMVRAYLEGERFLAEWTRVDQTRASDPPKSPLASPKS